MERLIVFGIWFLIVLSRDMTAIPYFRDFIERRGVLRLIPQSYFQGLLTSEALFALQVITLILLAIVISGIRHYRVVAVLACALLTLYVGIIQGMGEVSHADLPPLYAAYLLALLPAELARRPIAIMLVLTYVMIAAHRVLFCGLEIITGDSMLYWLALKSSDMPGTWDLGLYSLTNDATRFVAKAGFAITTVLELLAPVCLFSRRFTWIWLALIIPFHVVSKFTMNIFFWQSVVMLPVFFLDWRPKPRLGKLPILFYDGECGLCDRSVQWLLARDPLAIFRFAALQGETAREMLHAPDREALSTMFLIDEKGVHRRSTAALRAVSRLGGVYALTGLLLVIPRAIRDAVYQFVAAHRLNWFGRVDQCRIPSATEQARLLG
jgi:predicted DCC family thiol-disulfide oxidoreductase YuxK